MAARTPGIAAVATLAFAVVMVPGLAAYAVVRAAGAAIGPAGLAGLLFFLVGTCCYPVLLRRLGWVGTR